MYIKALKEYESFRKAASSLNLTKSKFVRLWKIELGLCQRKTSCKNKPELGKTGCRKCLNYVMTTENKVLKKEYNKKWTKDNRRYLNNYTKLYRINNIENSKKYNKKYNESDKGRATLAALAAKRRASKLNAKPKWVDNEALREVYKNCPRNYHVDHIIPLRNKDVCGLHVPWNLQYLTPYENDSKFNKFDGTRDNNSWRLGLPLLKREHTKIQLESEFKLLTTENRGFKVFPSHNRITTHFNTHFYEIENNLWNDPKIKEKLLLNREKYLNKDRKQLTAIELLRGFKISGIHIGFSHHSPFWIKSFIKKYKIKSIYDPCGGWGHRLLGSYDINYIYNDLDKRSCKGAKDIIKYFDLKNKIVHNKDACEFTPDQDYEAVFTCPPYFNTEVYNYKGTSTEKFKEYQSWLNGFWRNLLRCSIKPGVKYFAFVINNTYKEDLKEICESEGLRFLEEIKVGKSQISHLNRTSKTHKGEYLLVFSTSQ